MSVATEYGIKNVKEMFTIEILGMYTGDTVNTLEFDSKAEAKKEIRRMIREDGYTRGYKVFNLGEGLELHTNF